MDGREYGLGGVGEGWRGVAWRDRPGRGARMGGGRPRTLAPAA